MTPSVGPHGPGATPRVAAAATAGSAPATLPEISVGAASASASADRVEAPRRRLPTRVPREEADRVRRFKPEHVPESVDAVVIGSGIGGLVAAGLLAKAGRRVLVLEQHSRAGGCLHTFRRGGVELDTGLHYGGLKAFGEGRGVRELLDSISYRPIAWHPMDPAFDRVRFADDPDPAAAEFAVHAGRARQIADLVRVFPAEEAAIRRYFELSAAVQQISSGFFAGTLAPRLLGRVGTWLGSWLGERFHVYSDRSLDDVLREVTTNERLRALLGYAWGDVGNDPRRISFAVDAMVRDHYSEGAAFPVGGSAAVADSIVSYLQRQNGSRVLIGARVVGIETDANGVASGVHVEYGARRSRDAMFVPSAAIVSTIGAIQTDRLLAEPLRRSAAQLPAPSVAHLMLFIRFDGASPPPTARSNTWVFARADYGRAVDEFQAAMLGPGRDPIEEDWEFPGMFISFPSAKDPSWCDRYGSTVHTCQIVTPVPYALFAPFADTQSGHRGAEYLELKERFTEKLLQALERHFPEVRRQVTWHDLGTPLTSEHFLGSEAGSSYGADTSPERYRMAACTALTPVPGLSLGGQDAASPGVAGAAIGGVFGALVHAPWTVGWQNIGPITRL